MLPDEVADPCGLIAKSFFNDEFKITKPNDIVIKTDNIAWPNDKTRLFKNSLNSEKTQWRDKEDERYF